MLPKNLPAIDLKSINQCFACGKDNPIGLKLKFAWDGETAKAEFIPTELHQGWQGIVHGGIICTLLDEAMAYVAYFQGLNSVTAKTEVRFKQAAPIHETLLISATTVKKTRKLLEAKATITLKDGTKIAEGSALTYILNQQPPSQGILWDMDGVIANTAPFHFQAWRDTFTKRGVKFTKEDFDHTFGLRNDSIIRKILGKKISAEDIEVIAQEKEANFRHRLPPALQPLPGVIQLLKALKDAGFKMALASSAPKENLDLLTLKLGVKEYFDAVVSDKEAKKGKPSPDLFLLAAEKLKVPPHNCIVIEDAIAGVAAAKAAQMKCIAVTNTHPKESLIQADIVVDSLEQVDTSIIQQLLENK